MVPPSEPLMPSAGRGRPATRPPGRSDGAWITPAARFYKQGAPPELAGILDGVPEVGGVALDNVLVRPIPKSGRTNALSPELSSTAGAGSVAIRMGCKREQVTTLEFNPASGRGEP